MGDRVLFQVWSSKSREFGPVVYGHWSGARALDVVESLRSRMTGRLDDVSYTSARLVQELVGQSDGNLGFGLWNVDHILTAEDSHGDAGVVLIDVSTPGLPVTCLGGYLARTGEQP